MTEPSVETHPELETNLVELLSSEVVKLVLLCIVLGQSVIEPKLTTFLEFLKQFNKLRMRLVEDRLLLLIKCLNRGVDKRVAGLLFRDRLGVVRVHLASTQPLAAFSRRTLGLLLCGSHSSSHGRIRCDRSISTGCSGGSVGRVRVGCSCSGSSGRVCGRWS